MLPYEGLLWLLRGVLLLCLIAHVYCSAVLYVRARRARGRFRRRRMGVPAYLAQTMPATGVILLLFIVFHILDLTLGVRPVAPTGFQAATPAVSSAYDNLLASFGRPPVATVYILAMLDLALHLIHGIVGVVVDLGLARGPRFRLHAGLIALVFGLAVALGNISVPIAVLTGALS